MDVQVKALRLQAPGTVLDTSMAAELLLHLVFRTASIRSAMAEGARYLAERAASIFGDAASAKAVFGLDHPSPSEELNNLIAESVAKSGVSALGVPPSLASRLLLFGAREEFEALFEQNVSGVAAGFAGLIPSIATQIRDAHNEALSKNLNGSPRAADLATYTWQVEEVESVILPDCIAVCIETDGAWSPFLMAKKEHVSAILMPLSNTRMLIGTRDVGADWTSQLNEKLAACSEDFFVCPSPLIALADCVGARARGAALEAVDQAVESVRSRYRPQRLGTKDITKSSQATQSSFSYSVRLSDWGDDQMAAQVGAALEAVVRETSRTMPLEDLDGFTFATDYEGALRSLDRGDPSLPRIITSALAYGSGVAKAPNVIRDGVRRTHLVLRDWIGFDLVSGDEAQRRIALHVIVSMLAKVAHDRLYGATIEDPDQVIRQPMPMLLHGAASSVSIAYFSARESGGVAPTYGEIYSDLVVQSLSHADAAISVAKSEYFVDDDLDKLLGIALPAVSAVLNHVADLLGHCEGVGDDAALENASLVATLEAAGLVKWIRLYRADLAALYDRNSPDFSLERLIGLDSHVERLLWRHGILPWPMENGEIFVTVGPSPDVS